jgi:hypothetical protein
LKLLTLNQAAETCHKSKAAILKAIRSGRLSAKINEKRIWEIDPAELHRVYPYTIDDKRVNNELPEVNIKVLETLLEKEKQERERERQQYENTINKLWLKLEEETEERKNLTKLIENKSYQQKEPIKKENFLFKKIFKKMDRR